MTLRLFAPVLILSIFFTPLVSESPNTDEFFISEFLREMDSNFSNFSGSHCSWRGVFCDPTGQYIVRLELSNLSLSGIIPENTIGKMSKLEKLDLSNNRITSLPGDFWSLNSLAHLDLSHNQFSGVLPNNIANFAQLVTLDLSSNNFSEEIPETIDSLTGLRALNLSNNMFGSWIPSGILRCTQLVSIDLSRNNLNGSVPSGFGEAFPLLQFLNLAGNRVSGRGLDLAGMKSIQYVNVSGNSFEGSLGEVISNPSSLVYLDVAENQFSGEFSADLIRAVNLKYLNLADNRFSKQRCLKVDTLLNLEYMNLSRTSLVGEIPEDFARLNGLKVLDLSNNELTGRIPTTLLEHLHGMKSFNFSNNLLSFCPSGFSNDVLKTSFDGLINMCPIAADPGNFKTNSSKHKGLTLGLVLSLSLLFSLIMLLFLAFRCQRRNRMWAVRHGFDEEERPIPEHFPGDSTTPVVIFEKPLLNFTYSDLTSATHNFDRSTLLAEGRFGSVYSAQLPGGVCVAIKVLAQGSSALTDPEVSKELNYLGRIRHPNLVSLTGYCLARGQTIIIYEYMDNGNLQNLLDYSQEDNGLLKSWNFRYKILLGTARALAFLHHGCSPPIIHRDVKASNVYLDHNLEPRLSHFGLGKIFGDNIFRGSNGYVAPELLDPKNVSLSTKTDVYAYGVILFEVVTGKKFPEGDEKDFNIVSWARGVMRMNNGSSIIDPTINGPEMEMVEALRIGYLCTAEVPSKRPSMHQVVGLLKDLEPVNLEQ